jgi:hypothetical protein
VWHGVRVAWLRIGWVVLTNAGCCMRTRLPWVQQPTNEEELRRAAVGELIMVWKCAWALTVWLPVQCRRTKVDVA